MRGAPDTRNYPLRPQGFPCWKRAKLAAKLRRGTQIGLGLALLATAMFAALASAIGIPEPGVVAGNPGGVVDQVDPGGPTWRDGIRVGDQVLDVGDFQGGWRILTMSGSVVREGTARSHLAVLRSHIPWALAALLIAALAALLAYRGHPMTAIVMPMRSQSLRSRSSSSGATSGASSRAPLSSWAVRWRSRHSPDGDASP